MTLHLLLQICAEEFPEHPLIHQRPKGDGFTLAEILVITGLLGVLVTLGVGIFLSHNSFYESQSGKTQLVNSLREAADRINEYARTAVSFEGSFLYGSETYTTAATTAIFKLPAIDSANNIVEGSFDYVIIGANPTALNRLELIVIPDLSSSRLPRQLLLTDKLTSLNFMYDNVDLSQAKKVDYNIEASSTGRFPSHERLFGSVTLRNK